MAETNKPPLLRSANLTPANLQSLQAEGLDPSKIEDAIEIEADVLLLKFMREELMSIFDELRPNITYANITESPFFEEENMLISREKLEEILNQGDRFKELIIQKWIELENYNGQDREAEVEAAVEQFAEYGFDPAAIKSYFSGNYLRDSVQNRKAGVTVEKALDVSALKNMVLDKYFGDLNAGMQAQGMEEADMQKVRTRLSVIMHKREVENSKNKGPEEGIYFPDYTALLNESWRNLSSTLIANLYEKNKDFYSHKDKKKTQKEVEESAMSLTLGQRRLILLMIKKYIQLNRRIDEMLANGGDQKVLIFIKSIAGKIKEALKNLKTIKGGVDSAKAAKLVAGLWTREESASVMNLEIDDIKEIEDLEAEQDLKIFGLKKTTAKSIGSERKGARELHDDLGNLVNTDTLTAWVNYSRELRHLHSMMKGGTIVETHYVKSIIDQAMPYLTKTPPTVVYLHGDFGTGKTAIATHISRTRFDKEPIIVAGNKFVEPDRFTEELKIERMEPMQFLNQQLEQFGGEAKFTEGENMGDMITALVGDKAIIINNIIERRKAEQNTDDIDQSQKDEIKKMVDDTFQNQVQGRYVIGAMYQAMKEGRPLIIDEANAITPEVMIAFNDLMTKKVGDKIQIRSDEKEITVKEGYCVIWTGNTGGRYRDARYNDVDPASFSRIASIKVHYLPQSLHKGDVSSIFTDRLELDRLSDKYMHENEEIEGDKLKTYKKVKEVAKTDQIFQVLMVKLLNKRLGARLLVKKEDKYSFYKDLYRLSTAARMIMDIFEENLEEFPTSPELARWIGSDTAAVVKSKLRKTNLTMRGLLDTIIASYQNEGMAMDLEYYIFNFTKGLELMPEEMAIVYTIMKQYGFFAGSGWEKINSAGDIKEFEKQFKDFNILSLKKYEKVDINGDYVSLLRPLGEDCNYELRYFSSLETMQLMFGYLPPRKVQEYKEMADIKDQQEAKNRESQGDTEKKEALRDIFERINEGFDPQKFLTGEVLDKSEDSADEIERIERKLEIAQKIRDFNTEIESIKINDADYIGTLSNDEYFEVAGKFCDMIIKLMESAHVIDSEEADAALGASVEERIKMVAAMVDKVNEAA